MVFVVDPVALTLPRQNLHSATVHYVLKFWHLTITEELMQRAEVKQVHPHVQQLMCRLVCTVSGITAWTIVKGSSQQLVKTHSTREHLKFMNSWVLGQFASAVMQHFLNHSLSHQCFPSTNYRYWRVICCTTFCISAGAQLLAWSVFFFCCRKCIRKTQVEAMQGAETTECREGANGQMSSDLRREKGVALPGTPVEWFTVNQNKKKANQALQNDWNLRAERCLRVWWGILWLFYTLHHSILGGILC